MIMKDLLFYFKPSYYSTTTNYSSLFSKSIIIYFITIIVYISISFIFQNSAVISSGPTSNYFILYLLRTIGLLIKQPFQVLLFSVSIYLTLNVFLQTKFTFIPFYKMIFIAFNLVVLSYFIEILNEFAKYLNTVQFINILKYSLNDIFTHGTDCSKFTISLLNRIHTLLAVSIIYAFYILKSNCKEVSNFKLFVIIVFSVLMTTIVLSYAPLLFIIITNLFRN